MRFLLNPWNTCLGRSFSRFSFHWLKAFKPLLRCLPGPLVSKPLQRMREVVSGLLCVPVNEMGAPSRQITVAPLPEGPLRHVLPRKLRDHFQRLSLRQHVLHPRDFLHRKDRELMNRTTMERQTIKWLCGLLAAPAIAVTTAIAADKAGSVTPNSRGLHGYIGFGIEKLPPQGEYTAGMGFYAAVWPLVDQPLANFQIGLPSQWIQPDNSDNKDKPLAPEGTLARKWKERGPTWSSVFQTVEGGLGYWAGNHFRYGLPKFSMNGTPQCYDYEVGSPGWSFFYSNEALPENRLGIAQLSNRLLIPPDALPFQGNPNGEFLGYSWMALPFTDATTGDPPTGDQSWTCFLSTANFKGPIAYYIPETWSKVGKLFNEPFLYGRGLDTRPAKMGGGAMEINTVPRFDAQDAQGTVYSKIPKLQWPVDAKGRAYLVQDVTYYSKKALYDGFKAWRNGGLACSGQFDPEGAFKPNLNTHTTRFDQAGEKMIGVERAFDTRIFDGNVWGLEWTGSDLSGMGLFPQYYKHIGGECVAIPSTAVPTETKLLTQEFKLGKPGRPYTSPVTGAWATPGPKLGPFTAMLTDGSVVTYSWYRFVDQPSFQQYNWSAEKKSKLQAFVEKLHASWRIDLDYMAPPTRGKLVALDPALLVTPPKGLEVGYVPIVTHQEFVPPDLSRIVTPEMLSGRYQRDPKQNNWHEGELKQEGDKHSPSFRWINQAGVSWVLTSDLVQARLLCAKESPYFGKETGSSFIIEMQPPSEGVKPAIAGFHFNGDFYKRIGD